MFIKLLDEEGETCIVKANSVVCARSRGITANNKIKARTRVNVGSYGEVVMYVRETPEEILRLLPSA